LKINVIASGSGGNGTIISDGVSSLLLDAGIPIKRLLGESDIMISDIAGCLVSHDHGDHAMAAGDLAKRGLDIYASRGTFDSLGLSGHRCHAAAALRWFNAGTFEVMPFDVVHDAPEPFGFWAKSAATGENALYFSDTAYVKYRFDGITHLVAECNHGEYELRRSVRNGVIDPELAARIVKNHMSLERLIDFLEANDLSRLKQVHLIHMSTNNSDADRFREAVRRVTGKEVYAHDPHRR
jgi:phosphoribosyl 1,2-cyclic phosphodiesterase